MKINIKRQLKQLYNINFCFIYESCVYEVINNKKYKYRKVFDFDDYDYVDDKKLKKKLDKHLKSLKKYLT